jgi:hypothetical protein
MHAVNIRRTTHKAIGTLARGADPTDAGRRSIFLVLLFLLILFVLGIQGWRLGTCMQDTDE